MGSLSRQYQPSGYSPNFKISYPFIEIFCKIEIMRFLLALSLMISSSNSILDVKSKSVVKYLGDTFLLPDGCPSEDPVVQRFYKLCLETRGGDTLCTTDRFPNGRSLTIPAFSNICSAICHNMPEDGMKICPYKGKVLDFSFDNQELNRLEATNSNTFQRRFSFGK